MFLTNCYPVYLVFLAFLVISEYQFHITLKSHGSQFPYLIITYWLGWHSLSKWVELVVCLLCRNPNSPVSGLNLKNVLIFNTNWYPFYLLLPAFYGSIWIPVYNYNQVPWLNLFGPFYFASGWHDIGELVGWVSHYCSTPYCPLSGTLLKDVPIQINNCYPVYHYSLG